MASMDSAYNKQYYAANREKLRARAAAWRAANPDKVRASRAKHWATVDRAERTKYNKKYYAENRDRVIAKNTRYREENPGRVRATRYGFSVEDQDRLFAAQGHVCAICRATISLQVGGGAHLDHDHDTGEVRGFLCRNCNVLIGHANDSPTRLRAAAAYLDKRQPKLRLVR